MGLAFFSLTPDSAAIYRNSLFTQIHEIIFHGKGGYDWHTIYDMPIWLRNFTFKAIQNHYKEANSEKKSTVEESIANMRSAGAVAPRKEVSVPNYVTKASKK